MRVLVIAPHPDDEVLGCGGTIARHVAIGDRVYLCVITQAYTPDWSENEIKMRRKEVLAANRLLGIAKTFFLDFPTVKLDTVPHKDLDEAITRVINKMQPEKVYIPHPEAVNKDHRLVFDATLWALRPLPESPVRWVLAYETLSETEWAAPFTRDTFTPNLFIDITETLGLKLKAMSAYKLELKKFPHPRSPEAISALAKLRGSSIGVKAAEAFMLIRGIER